MGKRAPEAPDPYATAQAQAGMNRETAITQQQLNMVNQYNPWGSVEYRQIGNHFTPSSGGQQYAYNPATGEYRSGQPPITGYRTVDGEIQEPTGFGLMFGLDSYDNVGKGGIRAPREEPIYEDGWQQVQGNLTPQYGQYTNLTPEQQAIFDQSQKAELNLAGLASEQSAKLKEYLGSPFEFTNRDAETWAYDLASPRILEQQRQNQAALQTQLRNQGLAPGSAAWNAEMNRLTQGNSDQLNQLALTGRGQAFAEALAQRNQPINEITALLSGSQVSNPAQMSSPTPQTGVAGVDYTGLVNNKYQAEMSGYNSQMNALGGLFGLGTSFLMKSDRRSKRDIKKIGELKNGLGWYEFNYKTDSDGAPIREGVMSDEVRLVMPDAVVVGDDGFDMVDYSKVLS